MTRPLGDRLTQGVQSQAQRLRHGVEKHDRGESNQESRLRMNGTDLRKYGKGIRKRD